MIQSSMLATFAQIPHDKLPKVVEALNAQINQMAAQESSKVQITFMQASHDGLGVIRAQIVTEDFTAAEHMSDKVEELLSKLGGMVSERLIAS